MLKMIKLSALQVLKHLRVFQTVRDGAWRQRRLLILCYHGIAIDDEHRWSPALYISKTDFEERLKLIQRGGYTVLPLAEALERLYAKALPPRSVCITFDDGNYDFFLHAHPLLKKYGFPSTVYLSTYYCENQGPVFDVACTYLLWKGRGKVVDAKRLIGTDAQWDLRTRDGRAAAGLQLFNFMLHEELSPRAKEEFINQLATMLQVDIGAMMSQRMLHLMTPSEVKELAAQGVDFQLHTHRHRTPLDRILFLREIEDNRIRIQRITGKDPVHFCYPSGVVRSEFFPWLREAKVTSGTTCRAGVASASTDALLLPRVIDGGHLSPVEIEGWLSGVSAFFPRRRYTPSSPRVRADAHQVEVLQQGR